MSISRLEQETIINFNEEEQIADVYTHNKALINQLEKLRQKSTEISLVREDKYSKTYTIPKKWVKIRTPLILSEEERAKRAEIARERFGWKKNEGEV